MHHLTILIKRQEGATALEYAFIAMLISIAIVGGVALIGGSVTGMFNNIVAGFAR